MEILTNIFLTLLVNKLTKSFFIWINNKAIEYKDSFKIDISIAKQNKSIKKLLLKSINIAMKNDKIQILEYNDIKISLRENMHLIFEWIVIDYKLNIPFSDYSEKIVSPVYKDIFNMFYNSLFYQIQDNKNEYENLQGLMIFEKIDKMESRMISRFNDVEKILGKVLIAIEKDSIYTGELKEIEEILKLRQFKKARMDLLKLEQKIINKDDRKEVERYYQLLTDSYLLDIDNQNEAIKPLEKLIEYTTDDKKLKLRKINKYLLERNIDLAQNELDNIFQNSSNDEVEQSYIEIQINIFLNQRKYDLAIELAQKNKAKLDKYPLWLCKLYYYQFKNENAIQVIDENKDYFNKPDFEIKIIKINVLLAFHLEQAAYKNSFENIEKLKSFIPDVNEVINICEDDYGEKSHLYSALGLIYSALNDNNNAIKNYEKSLELNPNNINTLKWYPFILINSKNKKDKERALELTKQYLLINQEDHHIEEFYFNELVLISPQKAIIEIQNYKGDNNDIRTYLIYAYDTLLEYTKAEELIEDILSKEKVSSTACISIGQHYEVSKNYNRALEYYFRAIDNWKKINDLDRAVDKILKITIFLKDKKLLLKGVEAIEKHLSFDDIVLRYLDLFTYAVSLLCDYVKCFKYCDAAIKNGIITKNIYESLFCCYYNTGNFSSALEIVEKYTNDFGHQLPSNYLQPIIICCINSKDNIRASEIINYLPLPVSVNDFICQIQYLSRIKKNVEAINLAQKAYLTFPNNQYIMEHFIHLILKYKGNNVLSDEIIINYHKCLSGYMASDFPNKMLKEYKIDTNAEPEEILKQISAILPDNKEYIDKLEIINNNRLPISFYKHAINRNLLIFYNSINNQKEYKIWCYDEGKSLEMFKNVSSIYIDFGSIILLDSLDLLKTLPEIFSEVNIPQSVYDELYNIESEMPSTEERLIINKDNNGKGYITSDTIPYNELLLKSKRIIDFINNNKTMIKIVGRPLNEINTLSSELEKLIKFTYENMDIKTIEYSYISNNPIMLENFLLRKLYDSVPNSPKSFGVIDYLQLLVFIKKLTYEQYCQILSIMVKQNYASLPLNFNILFYYIKNNNYIIDESISHVFEALCSNDYNVEYSFDNIIATIFMIWNINIKDKIKQNITDYLINKLFIHIKLHLSNINEVYNNISKLIIDKKNRKAFEKHFKKYIKDFDTYSNMYMNSYYPKDNDNSERQGES